MLRTLEHSLFVFFVALAGCGGNVVIDDPSGTGGSTSSSTTTVFDPSQFCLEVCTLADQKGCLQGQSVSTCTDGCATAYEQAPDCADEITALYQCAEDSIQQYGCDSPSGMCDAEVDKYSTCVGISTCGANECGGSGTGTDCFCVGECKGATLETDCQTAGDGSIVCSCIVDGSYAGSCTDGDLSCDLFNGCCAVYFPI